MPSLCVRRPKLQLACSCCTGGARSCYWSSAPSADAESVDWLQYAVAGPAELTEVEVLAYCAFWQPSGGAPPPAYWPKEVVLWAQYEGGREVELCRFAVPAAARLAPVRHRLPTPALLTAPRVRVELRGKWQRQLLPGQEEYFSCINYVYLRGRPLLGFTAHPRVRAPPRALHSAPHRAAHSRLALAYGALGRRRAAEGRAASSNCAGRRTRAARCAAASSNARRRGSRARRAAACGIAATSTRRRTGTATSRAASWPPPPGADPSTAPARPARARGRQRRATP